MDKIICICSKICCGKSYYANILKDKENAVILSCNELTDILFGNNLGCKHDEMFKRIWKYLLKKAVDTIKTNTSVILDWFLGSKDNRNYIKNILVQNTLFVNCIT